MKSAFPGSRSLLIIISLALVIAGAGYVWYTQTQVEPPVQYEITLEECSGTLTVLYDNYEHDSSCQAEWGFSCLVELEETTILFDTGGEEEVLEDNIYALGVEVDEIDCIVISHEHWDHIGGINAILSENSDVTVYLPACFTEETKSGVRATGATVVETDGATLVCPGVATTNVLRGPPREQSLMIATDEGLIILTGCSHPGVHNIVENAINLTGLDVRLVMGGYHLRGTTGLALDGIISDVREMGVETVAPSHCTGDAAIVEFMQEWGEDCIRIGVGYRSDF